MRQRTRIGLLGLGLATLWGATRARLTFGAVPDRLTLIFDGSCDFCTQVVRHLRTLDPYNRVTIVPFQRPGFPEANGLTVAQCEGSIWAITPDSATYSAAAAASLTGAVIFGMPLPLWLYSIPGIRAALEAAYRWVARNRSSFPGDRPYCEQYPEECGG